MSLVAFFPQPIFKNDVRATCFREVRGLNARRKSPARPFFFPPLKQRSPSGLLQANTFQMVSFVMNSVLKFLKIVANILKVAFTSKSRFQPLLETSGDRPSWATLSPGYN